MQRLFDQSDKEKNCSKDILLILFAMSKRKLFVKIKSLH